MKKVLILTILILFLLISCPLLTIEPIETQNIGINPETSGCGGFETEDDKTRQYEEVQCADERLIWKYNPATSTVHFLNNNLWLNCCGIHTITVKKEDSLYIIEEKDEPDGFARCMCMCLFDFSIDIPDIVEDTVAIELYRHITDNQDKKTKIGQWELDLMQQEGDILIEANVGYCN